MGLASPQIGRFGVRALGAARVQGPSIAVAVVASVVSIAYDVPLLALGILIAELISLVISTVRWRP